MEEKSLQEFAVEVKKARGPKTMKVTNSFGVYDAYKDIRKNGWYDIGKPISEHDFYAIIRGVNNLLAEELSNGREIVFPARMGKLELRKNETGVSLVNGKLRIKYPVDWGETIRLWLEDEEARNSKTLLRDETKYIYKIKYVKFDANYENKSFYQFVLNRFIKKALKTNIKQGKIDTLW